MEEEKRLVLAVTPVLSLALEKSDLAEELREINQRLVEAEEAERARIARDIHDGPLQNAMLLGGMGGFSAADSGRIAIQLAQGLREICARLRRAILDDLGLVPALEWLLGEASQRSDLSASLYLENVDEDERYSSEVELALFRVTQEAANNAVKHSKSTSLDVTLTRECGDLVLNVRDEGIGFSASSLETSGLGLTGMRERLVQLKGSFEVVSEPGAGTTVIARVPTTQAIPRAVIG